MFGKLLQTIFLPKQTRDRLAAQPNPADRPALAPSGAPQVAAGRGQLLTEAMTVYRAGREVYEALDAETRRRIEEDAAKTFGAALGQRPS
jgi:hypothetical protein